MPETPTVPQPDQAASRSAVNPLTTYQRMKENALKGKGMDVGGFLTDLADLDSTGVIDQQPQLKDRILQAGQDPLLWLEVYRRTRDSINAQDQQQIQKCLRIVHLLGMDQASDDPRRQAVVDQVNQWKAKFQEVAVAPEKPEIITPTEETLKRARIVAEAIRRLMAQHNISEDEAIEGLRRGQTGKQQKDSEGVQNPARRRLLINTLKLGGALLAAAAVGRLTVPSPQSPEQTEKEKQATIFDEFIRPMKEEVQRRRAERAGIDPEYYHRVDRELNEDRINILLFISGAFLRWGLEPTENRANQIISFNTKTKTVDLISITGDVRGPKAEQYAESKGQPRKIIGINDAFDIGRKLGGSETEALKLLGETFEEATGLSVDFQGVGTSGMVKDFIDQVFGAVEVDVPYNFDTYKVEIDGVEYPDYLFREGQSKMDGVRVVQYIAADDYDRLWTKGVKDKLHHNRKHIIFDSIRKQLKRNLESRVNQAVFGTKFLAFLKQQLDRGRLKLDFELSKVLNFGVFVDPNSINKSLGFDQVKEGQSVLIVDDVYGGEGVKTVKVDAEYNPKSREYFDKYPDLWWMQVPLNSNPDSKDLVKDYWGVPEGPRQIIRRRLLTLR